MFILLAAKRNRVKGWPAVVLARQPRWLRTFQLIWYFPSAHQAQGVLKCCGSGREVVRLALRSLQPGGIQCSHKDYDKRHKLQMPRECSYKIL